jgi:hypothetical protein
LRAGVNDQLFGMLQSSENRRSKLMDCAVPQGVGSEIQIIQQVLSDVVISRRVESLSN